MTFESDVESQRYHSTAFYFSFDGILPVIATHAIGSAPWSLGETAYAGLVRDSISGGDRSMNRERNYIEDGGMSWAVLASSDINALLRRRGGSETTIQALTAAGSTVILNTGTGTYSAGTAIYVGRETIILTTHAGAGVYTGCIRGAYGSQAIEHDNGEKCSDVPLHWYARNVTLTAVNLAPDGVVTTRDVWFGSLSASPSFADGVWQMEATGRINDLLNRPILSGFSEFSPTAATIDANNEINITISGSDGFFLAPGGNGGFVRIDFGDSAAFYYFDSADLTADALILGANARVWGQPSDPWGSGVPNHFAAIVEAPEKSKIRQVDLVTGYLGKQALRVMLSFYGNNANHSFWDILPGRAPNATSAPNEYIRRRVGAAIPSSAVDVNSWALIPVGGPQSVTWLDEPTRLGDFLSQNILWRCGGYAYINSTGQLAFREYLPACVRGAITTTLNAQSGALVATANTVDDETVGIGRVDLRTNWDPISRDYRRITEVLFFDEAPIYGERVGSIDIETKGVNLSGGPLETKGESENVNIVLGYFDRQRARASVAGRRLSLLLPWQKSIDFVPGFRFFFTDSRIPDHEGATGVTERIYEVTGWKPDFGDGTINVDCDEVQRGWVITPSAEVASYDAGTRTITLSTTGRQVYSDNAFPGADFPDSCYVRVYDASAAVPLSSSERILVDATTNTTIHLFDVPVTAPAAGDIIVIDASGDLSTTNDVTADVEDFSFGADTNYLIGAGTGYERAGTRWE